MNPSIKVASAILLAIASCGWSQSSLGKPESAQPAVSEIARNFTNFLQVTKGPVLVNPELALLCRGVSKADIEAARVKHGPHANTAILIYMNPAAAEAFRTNAGVFPVGAAVVKQKSIHGYLGRDGNHVREADRGVGGMVKRSPGYDPKHGDWEYFYFEDAKKMESGRIASCVQCHESAKRTDYVFGTWSKAEKARP